MLLRSVGGGFESGKLKFNDLSLATARKFKAAVAAFASRSTRRRDSPALRVWRMIERFSGGVLGFPSSSYRLIFYQHKCARR